MLKLGAANNCFDGPVRGTGKGLQRGRSPTLNPTVNLSPLIENLRRHSRRLGVWDTEETLDVALQRPLVSSVVDFDHGRFQIRTTMEDGEGSAPDSNHCEEEKRVKERGHDFVSPSKEKKSLERKKTRRERR